MTTMEKICAMILKLNKKNLTASDLIPEASLVDDLNLDSLDRSELLVMTEDAFSISIPTNDLATIKTLGDTVKYVDKRLAKG